MDREDKELTWVIIFFILCGALFFGIFGFNIITVGFSWVFIPVTGYLLSIVILVILEIGSIITHGCNYLKILINLRN